MTRSWTLAGAAALILPAAAAFGQMTGVSHPEAVPDTPLVTQEPARVPAPTPTLQTHPQASTSSPRPESTYNHAEPYAPSSTAYTGLGTPSVAYGSEAANRDGNIVTRLPGPSNELPIGTYFKTRLSQTISTVSTPQGTTFTAELLEPVDRDGRVLLPPGSIIEGRITDIHGGKRSAGAAFIHLQPQVVTLPDGTRYRLHAQVIDSDMYASTKVDNEGTIIQRDHSARSTAVLGLTTGAAATAGALIAGVPGALIGAGIGAGASAVVWMKGDSQTVLPANSKVVFSLTEPLAFPGLDASIPNFSSISSPKPSAGLR